VSSNENVSPVSLPVIDSMFFVDQDFAKLLKERLGLSDEQVSKIRSISREETSRLEKGYEESMGSAQAARENSFQKISSVVGEQKARDLMALVRDRWQGPVPPDAIKAVSTQPNMVPGDTRIVVNAPAFRMDVFESGKLIKTYRIGIGYPEFPLPEGLRGARQIIFNPSWTPPDEPWVESSRDVKVGETVEPGSKLNPLGIAKIPIGLPSLIHGGKREAQLGGFASHGCVGLTDSMMEDFSLLLARISGATLSPEDIAAAKKKRDETKTIDLSRPIPVELRYETIVVIGGKLHIYRDLYDRDTNTEESLNKVLQAHGITLDQLTPAEKEQVRSAIEKMALNAQGKVESATPSPTSTVKLTRRVKGEKEIVIPVAALSGKGYPAPMLSKVSK
jgi:lipoprotein-anchoring transpeptidase ErfK/SrfK